jgi:hypothetical protein
MWTVVAAKVRDLPIAHVIDVAAEGAKRSPAEAIDLLALVNTTNANVATGSVPAVGPDAHPVGPAAVPFEAGPYQHPNILHSAFTHLMPPGMPGFNVSRRTGDEPESSARGGGMR